MASEDIVTDLAAKHGRQSPASEAFVRGEPTLVLSELTLRELDVAPIAGMNHEEIIRWLRSQPYSDPFLQRLADKAAQQGDLPADGAARPPRGGEVAVGRRARRKALTRRLEHGHIVADTPTVGYE